VELEIQCFTCHGQPQAQGFVIIGHDACQECHEDLIDADEITEDTCGFCHKVKDLDDIGKEKRSFQDLSPEVFVHTLDLTNRCTECHSELFVPELERVPERIHPRLSELDPGVVPDSHRQNWMKRHGALSEEGIETCKVCHQDESCKGCHQITAPRSHNNLWRLKTHGLQASWNRQRCQACHEQDFCTSCHEAVKPRTHTAGWRQGHCYQCHTELDSGAGCATCHDNALDSHPNPHTAGWRSRHCNSCHPGSEEEKQCRVCHPGSIGTHPDPHSAGWRNRHCFSCHAQDATGECNICHDSGNGLLLHDDFWPPVHDRFGDRVDCYFCHKP
jgi:hypothetical protein